MVRGVNDPNAWTVISRHGEYGQSETECNVPSAITQTGSELTITTAAQSTTCGGWNQNGTVRESPSSFPYRTGDLQWNTFNFTYGSVVFRAKAPASDTNTWPAIWMLANNCQLSNKYSGDTYNSTSPTDTSSTCPNIGDSTSNGGYHEVDMLECYNSGGWCQFHVANPSFGIGNGCDATYLVDTNYHVYQTIWTASSLKYYMDGKLVTTCNQSMSRPMFLIMQTQTGGVGGTPSNLPAQFVIDYVKVCNTTDGTCPSVASNDASVIFYDDFNGIRTNPAAPVGLTATVN
jgi:beta-glucanase (GH16 family)